MNKKLLTLLAPLAALAFGISTAQANIITIDPFMGDHSEGWESGAFTSIYVSSVNDILGGTADAYALGGLGLHASHIWSFASTLPSHSGYWFAGNSGIGSGWEIVFDSAVQSFGGYFGTNTVASDTDAPDGTASFFDATDNLLGTASIILGNGGTWAWNGWESDMGAIKKVQLSNGSYDGGWLMLDDLQTIQSVPEPSSLLLMGIGLAGLGFVRRRKQS